MSEIIKRMRSESPAFFKNIQKLGITLGAIGGALLTIPSMPLSITLPSPVMTAAGYFVVCGVVAAAVAKLTVADPTVLKNEEPKP